MWRTLVRFHEKFWASKVFGIFVKNFRSSRSANSAFLLLKIVSTRRRLCQEVHKVFNWLQMFSRALNRNKSSQRKTYLPEVITTLLYVPSPEYDPEPFLIKSITKFVIVIGRQLRDFGTTKKVISIFVLQFFNIFLIVSLDIVSRNSAIWRRAMKMYKSLRPEAFGSSSITSEWVLSLPCSARIFKKVIIKTLKSA